LIIWDWLTFSGHPSTQLVEKQQYIGLWLRESIHQCLSIRKRASQAKRQRIVLRLRLQTFSLCIFPHLSHCTASHCSRTDQL